MYGELVEAARAGGGWVSASELVTPLKKKGGQQRKPGRPVTVGPDGEPVELPDGAEAAPRKRRRRRRKRSGQVAAGVAVPQIGPDGEPIPVPEVGAPAPGEPGTGEGRRRRRRRRRRSGRGGGGEGATAGGAAVPEGETTAGSDGGFAEGGELPIPSRSRRRRHRRPRPAEGGGEQGALALDAAPDPGNSIPAA